MFADTFFGSIFFPNTITSMERGSSVSAAQIILNEGLTSIMGSVSCSDSGYTPPNGKVFLKIPETLSTGGNKLKFNFC